MFGLAQQVGGDQLGVTGLVGDDEDLRRSGELIDADRPEHLPLRLVDEGIARPDDLVDGRHALGAVSQGGDGLRAADPEDAVGA